MLIFRIKSKVYNLTYRIYHGLTLLNPSASCCSTLLLPDAFQYIFQVMLSYLYTLSLPLHTASAHAGILTGPLHPKSSFLPD